MYALLDNNQIKVGPRQYNAAFFNQYLQEQQITDFTFPDEYSDTTAISVTPTIKLVKVAPVTYPQYNSLTEQIQGPTYNTATDPIGVSYTVVDRSLEAAKSDLKNTLAAIRYNRETSGIKVTIQGKEVSVDTGRGDDRNIWFQSFMLLSDGQTQQFKFPKEQVWLDLTKSDIGTIVQAIMLHIQSAFEWESTEAAKIDAVTSKADLIALESEIKGAQ